MEEPKLKPCLLQIIHQLEAAAILLKTGSYCHGNEKQQCEAIFTEFRAIKQPYDLFQTILLQSRNEFVLFSAFGAVTNAIANEWKHEERMLSTKLRTLVSQYTANNRLSNFILERAILLIAVLCKIEHFLSTCPNDERVAIESGCSQMISEMIQFLQQFESRSSISEQDKYTQIFFCKLISALLTEYSFASVTVQVGLNYNQHAVIQKHFEENNLKSILQCFLQLAISSTTTHMGQQSSSEALKQQVITVLQQAMTWQFSGTKPLQLLNHYEDLEQTRDHISLVVKHYTKEIIFHIDFIVKIFMICHLYHETDDYALAYDCLAVAASIHIDGNVVQFDEFMFYYRNFLGHFIDLLSCDQLDYKHSISLSQILPKLLTNFKIRNFQNLDSNYSSKFLKGLAKFTLKMIEGAYKENEESEDNESDFYEESLNRSLLAWTLIIDNKDYFDGELLQKLCIEIFTSYYRHHLSEPEGVRLLNESKLSEIHDFEESDRARNATQLEALSYMVVGAATSEAIDVAVNCITRILDSRTNHFYELCNASELNGTQLDLVYDDLNWSLLIGGFLVFTDSDDASDAIEINCGISLFSQRRLQANITNLNETMTSLSRVLDRNSPFDPQWSLSMKCDPVVRLFCSIVRLAHLESMILNTDKCSLLSPEISTTLMWFFSRFTATYLSNNIMSVGTSAVYSKLFENNSLIEKDLIDFLLSKIEYNISFFSSEKTVIYESMKLFCVICKNPHISHYVLTSERFGCFRNSCTEITSKILPKAILRGLFQGLVAAIGNIQNASNPNDTIVTKERNLSLNIILEKPLSQLTILIDTKNNSEIERSLNVSVKDVTLIVLETISGAIQGVNDNRAASHLFEILYSNFFDTAIQLMTMYKNSDQVVVHSIFQVYHQIWTKISIALDESKIEVIARQYCDIVLLFFEALNPDNRQVLNAENIDDQFKNSKTLLLIIKTLKFLLANIAQNHIVRLVQDSFVSMLPLMNIPLTVIPLNELAKKFYSLCGSLTTEALTVIVADRRDSVNDIYSSIGRVIESGLFAQSLDINNDCLTFVKNCAMSPLAQRAPVFVQSFLAILLQIVFERGLRALMLAPLPDTIMLLIVQYPDEYVRVVDRLVLCQVTETRQRKMASAFYSLSEGISFCNWKNFDERLKFKKNYEQFVIDAPTFVFS